MVYRTVCSNQGCGYSWNITVTRTDLSALASKLGCPRCSRRGGQLRTDRRLSSNSRTTYYRATLVFPATRTNESEPGASGLSYPVAEQG